MTMERVVVVEGHLPGPDELRAVVWRGPLAEFLANNKGVSEAELRADIEADGFHMVGGGAAPAFQVFDETGYDDFVAMAVEYGGE